MRMIRRLLGIKYPSEHMQAYGKALTGGPLTRREARMAAYTARLIDSMAPVRPWWLYDEEQQA